MGDEGLVIGTVEPLRSLSEQLANVPLVMAENATATGA